MTLKIRRIIIFITVVSLSIITLLVYVQNNLNDKYNLALENYNNQNWEEAINGFDKIAKFKDSLSLKIKAEEKMAESLTLKAKDYQNDNQLLLAYKYYLQATNYSDQIVYDINYPFNGLWEESTFDDNGFKSYILFRNNEVYYMANKLKPIAGQFTSKFLVEHDHSLAYDKEKDSIIVQISYQTWNIIVNSNDSIILDDNGSTNRVYLGTYNRISNSPNVYYGGVGEKESTNYSNYSLPYSEVTKDSEKGFAWAVAEREIKERLKSPSTAKFPTYNHATIMKSGNKFKVEGYVDAENSFGAKLRVNFTVEFEKTGSEYYKVIRATLDE